MMVRKKLAVVVAALGALQSGAISALGLGELALESSLNQPLNAQIKLLNIGELDTSQVLVRLANKGDFDRAGVSRDFFLSNIKFTVDIDKNGGGVIQLTTKDRVVEPYLNFLVETRWPNGRLLREYTVLLDLPVFSQAQPVAAAQLATSVIEQVRSQPQVVSPQPTGRSNTDLSSRQQLSGGQLKAGDQYRVRQNETLWQIAVKARPSEGISVQQTMVTIQRLNPRAFIKGNINTLKAGYVLRLPTDSEVSGVSDSEASKQVAAQNRAWKTGEDISVREGAQLDATPVKLPVADQTNEASRLSIATPGDSTDEGFSDGEGAGGNTSALREELSAAEEQLSKSQRSNEEMASRLDDMEAKMATLQRLLELKEDQLSALQNTADSVAESGAQLEQVEAEVVANTEEAPAPSEAAQPEAEQPKQVVVSPESKSVWDRLLNNPLYAGLGLGALALALVAVLMRRRRKDVDDQELLSDLDDTAGDSLADDLGDEGEVLIDSELVADEDNALENMNVGDFATDMDLAPEEELSFDGSLSSVGDSEPEVESPVQSETGDAIAESEIYIAYGRYQQAIDLLIGAIAAEPQRSDLYIKLLETCLETRDKLAFQQHYIALQSLGDEGAIAHVKEMLSTVDGVSDWLDDAPTASSNPGDAELIEDIDSGDTQEAAIVDLLSEDSLELDVEDNELDAFTGSATAQFDVADLEAQLAEEGDALDLELDLNTDLDADDLDLEVDLDLESNSEVSLADGSENLDLGDLELDSELDLELDELSLDSDLGDLAAEFDGGLDDDPSSLEVELDNTDLAGELDISSDVSDAEGDEQGLDTLLASDLDAEVALELDSDSDFDELELDGLDELPESDDDLELSSLNESLSSDDELALAGAGASAVGVALNVGEGDLGSDASDDEEFDFLTDADEVATKLDLARAYIDMGDADGARDILDEVLEEGNEEQKLEAGSLIERID